MNELSTFAFESIKVKLRFLDIEECETTKKNLDNHFDF